MTFITGSSKAFCIRKIKSKYYYSDIHDENPSLFSAKAFKNLKTPLKHRVFKTHLTFI